MLHNSNFPKKRKAAGGNQAALDNKQSNDTAIQAHVQRQRLLRALRESPLSTLEARRTLDILHPAARIQELRDRGHKIITNWQVEVTECGQEHRVANYVLVLEAHV